MAKYLCNVVETYRVETEEECDALIEEARNDSLYTLTKSSVAKKEVQQKGEIIDEYYLVSLTKFIQNPKEPVYGTYLTYTLA